MGACTSKVLLLSTIESLLRSYDAWKVNSSALSFSAFFNSSNFHVNPAVQGPETLTSQDSVRKFVLKYPKVDTAMVIAVKSQARFSFITL